MKQGMTSLDIAALAAELRPLLVGGRIEKAFQPEKDQVLLRTRQKGVGRLDLLFGLGRFVTPTKNAPDNPDKPSMVAQVLRTQLSNARIVGISQVGFDRILRIDTERGDGRKSVVLEVFGDGNLLLLDAEGTIVLPMRGSDYGARRLRKGEPYQPPPGGTDPLSLDLDGLRQAGAAAGRDLVRMLAVELGFGPLWAEELCLRAEVPKNAKPKDLDEAAWTRLAAEVERLGDEIARNDLAPAVVFEEGQPVDAVPFVLRRYPAPRFAHEEAATFREALDRFFVGGPDDASEEDDPRSKRFEEARGRLQRQIDQIEGALGTFVKEEAEAKIRGDTLYACFQTVDGIINRLNEARRERSWAEVADVLREAASQGNEAAQVVRALRPDTATAVLALEGLDGPQEVAVDLRQNVQDNADTQYLAAKKARSRAEGAGKALAEAKARLAELESKGLDAFGAAPQRKVREQRHFWFENYRWTLTPSGFIAVGGRNAGQNDAVVKKYLRDGDRYVHAEIHGAPSVVLRCAGNEPTEADLDAACQFAAASSRAWRQFGAASAYWVTPQQVSKTPRSGEFVPRGAWIVHGRRNVHDGLPMEWAVGLVRFDREGRPLPPVPAKPSTASEDGGAGEGTGPADSPAGIEKLAGGPPASVGPWASAMVRLSPGGMEPSDAAARLVERFGVTAEEAQAALPPGPVGGL